MEVTFFSAIFTIVVTQLELCLSIRKDAETPGIVKQVYHGKVYADHQHVQRAHYSRPLLNCEISRVRGNDRKEQAGVSGWKTTEKTRTKLT